HRAVWRGEAAVLLRGAAVTEPVLKAPFWQRRRGGSLVTVASAAVVLATAARGLRRSGASRPSPADLVTVIRALMSCAVAGLVADAARGKPPAHSMFSLSAGALALDAVDGWVARRTGSATPFGARFDGEVDAFLIATLSVPAARSF